MLRQRHTKTNPLNIVRNLDAFPKIPDEYKVGTCIGGALSILSRLLIALMVYKEIEWYHDSEMVFKFQPDTTMDAKLKIHIDMTVATPCRGIGADIVDSTNQNMFSFGVLEEDDTWWELCPRQQEHFDYMQSMNGYLREEWHSLTHLIFKGISDRTAGHRTSAHGLPERSDSPRRPHDACRIHGELTLNKVAGNLHIIGGKSLNFPRGHVHISPAMDERSQNYSHRINRFSFGDATLKLVHPLEGDEKVFTDSSMIAQYFIEVVPTTVKSMLSDVHTYQYSVKENIRPIDHEQGSHGIPGLYFKYDMSALRITVQPDRETLVSFVIRLCSVISGIVVISGILNVWLQTLVHVTQGGGHQQRPTGSVAGGYSKLPVAGAAAAAAAPSSGSNVLLSASVPDGYVCDVLAAPLDSRGKAAN